MYIFLCFGYTRFIRLILVEQRMILGHILAFYDSNKDVIELFMGFYYVGVKEIIICRQAIFILIKFLFFNNFFKSIFLYGCNIGNYFRLRLYLYVKCLLVIPLG